MNKNFYEILMKELVKRGLIYDYIGYEDDQIEYTIKHFDHYCFSVLGGETLSFYDWEYRLIGSISYDEYVTVNSFDTSNFVTVREHLLLSNKDVEYSFIKCPYFTKDNCKVYMLDDTYIYIETTHGFETKYYEIDPYFHYSLKDVSEEEYLKAKALGFECLDLSDHPEKYDEFNQNYIDYLRFNAKEV